MAFTDQDQMARIWKVLLLMALVPMESEELQLTGLQTICTSLMFSLMRHLLRFPGLTEPTEWF